MWTTRFIAWTTITACMHRSVPVAARVSDHLALSSAQISNSSCVLQVSLPSKALKKRFASSRWIRISTWIVTFAKIAACNWPMSRTRGAIHSRVDWCAERAICKKSACSQLTVKASPFAPLINTWANPAAFKFVFFLNKCVGIYCWYRNYYTLSFYISTILHHPRARNTQTININIHNIRVNKTRN